MRAHRPHAPMLPTTRRPPPRPWPPIAASRPPTAARVAADASADAATTPARLAVCVNRTCKRQGSEMIHRFAADLALPGLEVATCGCLGSCGAGPNVALELGGVGGGKGGGRPAAAAEAAVVAGHVATPAALVSLLRARLKFPPPSPDAAGGPWPEPLSERHLRAVQARLAGNAAAVDGRLEEALARYGDALRLIGLAEEEGEEEEQQEQLLLPPASLGAHLVISNMSAALLQLGHADQAARAAARAERGAPRHFCTAVVRLVDALYALGRFEEAGEAARRGLARHPALAERPEWREIRGALREKGEVVGGG